MTEIVMDISTGIELTPEDLAMLEKASRMEPVFDEDCPPATEEDYYKYHRVNPLQKLKNE